MDKVTTLAPVFVSRIINWTSCFKICIEKSLDYLKNHLIMVISRKFKKRRKDISY